MKRAERFLILGSESSFYQAGGKLAMKNAETIKKLAESDRAIELIDLITEVSVSGRAPSQSPGLFALALVIASTEDPKVKNLGFQAIQAVARTASTLFEFLGYLSQFKNLGGTGLKKAIGRWYNEKPVDKLAYQMVKYRQRGGFDHSRTLRLSKYVKSSDRPSSGPLLDWALGKSVAIEELPRVVQGFEIAKTADARDIPRIIREYGLSWEMLPTEVLNDVPVWEALLEGNVPLGALIRQLPRLTNLGLITQLGGWTGRIEDRLTDSDELRKARIHPVNALIAMRTYGQGYGERSQWSPVGRIVAALEGSFYGSFAAVEPTGKAHYLGIDVSQSMDGPSRISDKVPLSPREIAAVMAMVVARTEREHYFGAFQDRMEFLNITARDSLETVMTETGAFPFRGTNLSLPMMDALQKDMKVDAFVLFTDNENGLGYHHPFQALERYRHVSGVNAKIIVNAVTANKFSMADPSDLNALDIAGFDSNAPALIANFVR
jgi:60 kDa SS-A/Ro ribonucleoprotein